MATDLYHSALKDKDQLDRSNPRSRLSSGLSSSDVQYKNFLSGIKPRVKSNSTASNIKQQQQEPKSFVDSAARTQSVSVFNKTNRENNRMLKVAINQKSEKEKEEEKVRAQKAMYEEFSSVPHSKKIESTFNNNTNTERNRSGSIKSNDEFNFDSLKHVQSDSIGSVGRLRSLFDKNAEENTKQTVQFRKNTNKRTDRPVSTGYVYQDKKSNVSGIYEKQNSKEQRKSLDIESLLINENGNDNTDKNINVPRSPTKQSPRKTSNSEFENFEDHIVPTGRKKIDVGSILAPMDSEKENVAPIKTEEKRPESPRKEVDIKQILEIERMKRTQEEVNIEKRFNVKRRSLKERLSLLAAEEDGAIVSSYETKATENSSEIKSVEPPEDIIEPVHVTDTQEENDLFTDDKSDKKSNASYKSALERFDEFITKEDISEDLHSPKSPVDLSLKINSKETLAPTTDHNDNLVKLGGYDNSHSGTNHIGIESNTSSKTDNSDLMDSILDHMETSTSPKSIGKDYISLLRSSSLTEEDRKSKIVENRGYAPEVLPRLSKQLAYNQTAAVTPPLSEDEQVALSFQSSIEPARSDTSDTQTSEMHSRSTTDYESEYTDTCSSDEFQLPPPPGKSNLSRDKSREGLRVNFRKEKLHDVLFTYGPSEYDRANADIDPIASSAEWELEKRVDNMDIFSVDLQKDERGLGLSIIGLGVGTESGVEKLGIFVKTLTENGAAQKDGRIQVNDQILEVNGVSLVGVTQYFAAQTLKGTSGIVRFLMGREKSRRSHYAPGALLAESPEMQKHIEEMNKVLQQVDELEQRALNSETTLDDVRAELLRAEERAHEAEHQLQETKEQLKAVTESPFIGNQRKLKNEIKKKGGNKEKVDELQKNLKEVSNRLSTSEENLLMLTSVKDNKEKELAELYNMVEENTAQQKQLEESNVALRNELNTKSELVAGLQKESTKMQLKLDEQVKLFEEQKASFELIEAQHMAKVAQEEKDLTNKFFELENTNKSLKEEVKELQDQLKAKEVLSLENESLKKSSAELSESQRKLAVTEENLQTSQKLNGELKLEIETLTAQNDYLQSLITKLDRSHGQTSAEKTDLEEQFKLKQEQYMKENQELQKKISELEFQIQPEKPRFFPNIITEEVSVTAESEVESTPDFFDSDTPLLPKREYVNINFAQPPLVSRDSKPTSPIENNFTSEEVSLADVDSASDTQCEEVLEAVTVDNVESGNPTIDFTIDSSDTLSIPSITNPVPKPPRGHFVDVEEDFVIVQTPLKENKDIITAVEEQEVEQLPPIQLGLKLDQEELKPVDNSDDKVILENSLLVEGVSNSIITSAVAEASSPGTEQESFAGEFETKQETEEPKLPKDEDKVKKEMQLKYLLESKKPASPTTVTIPDSIEFDNLTEDTVDNDSDSDQGQFQLIAEEIQEEQSTPDSLNRRNVDQKKASSGDRSSFFQALNNEPGFNSWLDDEWKRLDSQKREEQAEKIAAQVTAKSPVRRTSSTSSSSSESEYEQEEKKVEIVKDENWSRTQSIKIDSSYFEKSPLQDSFDNEKSILDEEQERDNKDSGIVKSTSFDSAIPPTQMLDNRIALDKRQLVKRDEKRKPTHGTRGQLAEENDSFQISTLPRKNKEGSAFTPSPLKSAVSEPNLLKTSNSGSNIDKPEKQKHKFGFHIPKVFKKGKAGGKKSIHEDGTATLPASAEERKNSSPPAMERNESHSQINVKTASLEVKTQPPQMSPMIADAEIVPMEQRAESMSQERANDAATEEAVVPFATKELLMEKARKESVEEEPIEQGVSLNVEASSLQLPGTVHVSSSGSVTSVDDVEIKLPSSPSPNPSPTSSKSMTIPESKQNETFNERAIDVGTVENGHTEEDNITHWTRRAANDWDVRQVGLWLVEMNMSQYVNSFKSHNVDGHALLRADGNRLKEYGVNNTDHRAEIKKRIKEFRQQLGKDSFNKGKNKDHKSAKDKLQFWKGKYKVVN